MEVLTCQGPPSRFGLTLTFDPDEPICAERMLGALGLMHLSRDPDKVLWPVKLRKSSDLVPSIDELHGLKMDWQEFFHEDFFYQFLIPETLFAQVHQHCQLVFPDNIVVFKGPGRVAKVEISILPMDTPSILYGLWSQRKELDELRMSIRQLTRQVQLMEHNTAVITRELLSGRILQEEELHPDTPPTWITMIEEY